MHAGTTTSVAGHPTLQSQLFTGSSITRAAQDAEGPGSPYQLTALISQAQSHLFDTLCTVTHWNGMIKLLQWQQQVMSHSSQNAAVSEGQHCQTTEG